MLGLSYLILRKTSPMDEHCHPNFCPKERLQPQNRFWTRGTSGNIRLIYNSHWFIIYSMPSWKHFSASFGVCRSLKYSTNLPAGPKVFVLPPLDLTLWANTCSLCGIYSGHCQKELQNKEATWLAADSLQLHTKWLVFVEGPPKKMNIFPAL